MSHLFIYIGYQWIIVKYLFFFFSDSRVEFEREKVDTRDEDIDFWKEAVSHRDYKIKQYREKITKLKDMLDDVTKYGPKFYEFEEVLDDINEILNKSIYK